MITANKPEIEIAWPACPSLKDRSAATGVSRLTGRNSDATKAKAHSDIESTAPHTGRLAVCAGNTTVLLMNTLGTDKRRWPAIITIRGAGAVVQSCGILAYSSKRLRDDTADHSADLHNDSIVPTSSSYCTGLVRWRSNCLSLPL
ncbi:hypothetical protein D3C78_1507870 [compost metagenome]